jgi:hypothetical protein
MKIENAIQKLQELTEAAKESNIDTNVPTGQAILTAIKSLEAWEKVREDLRKFIDANKNSGDMYLEGRADGGWHALAAIRRCLGEIEDEIQAGDGGCQGPDQRDTGSVQG